MAQHPECENQPPQKISPRQEGPFKITKVIGLVTYQLKLPTSWKIHNVFHATLLQQFKDTEVYGENFPRPPPGLFEGDEAYNVEHILKHRKRGWGYQYYMEWKGYPILEALWEPEGVFSDDGNLLMKYKLKHHLWIPQQLPHFPFWHSKTCIWNKCGGSTIVWVRPNRHKDFLKAIKTTYPQTTFQNPPFILFCWKPARIFFQTTVEMSSSSDSSTPPFSEDNNYTFITSFKLSHLLLDPGITHIVSKAFSSSPLSTTMLQEYLFIS